MKINFEEAVNAEKNKIDARRQLEKDWKITGIDLLSSELKSFIEDEMAKEDCKCKNRYSYTNMGDKFKNTDPVTFTQYYPTPVRAPIKSEAQFGFRVYVWKQCTVSGGICCIGHINIFSHNLWCDGKSIVKMDKPTVSIHYDSDFKDCRDCTIPLKVVEKK